MQLTNVKLGSGFEPQKLTLKEVENELGVSGLRDLRLKHPYALKVIFQDWNDTATSFTWAVYRGDLTRLKDSLKIICPSPVEVVLSNKNYTYEQLAAQLGRTSAAISLMASRKPKMFTCVGKRGPKKLFDENTLQRLKALYSDVKPDKMAHARSFRGTKPKKVQEIRQSTIPPIDHTAIGILLIKNGFSDAGIWLIQQDKK